MELRIVNEKPPVYDRCKVQFGVDWDQGIVITYGDTIHTKVMNLPADIILHESVHIEQQRAYGKEAWWDRYFVDPDFRKSQETDAYREQGRFLRKTIGDRNRRFRILNKIATNMAVYYGDIFTRTEALGILES